MTIDAEAVRRYSRQLLVPEIGVAGQERLMASSVLAVGAGGLGSPALQVLAAAGVGRITVIDPDTVDETNLHRQTIFATADVGRPKASTAAKRLRELNPRVDVYELDEAFDERNGRRLVRDHDLVLDCTDRFTSRYGVNDACVLEGRPDVSASIFRFEGTLSVFAAGGPCYRCLYPQPPAGAAGGCAEAGVVGSVAAILGAWQANEALKILASAGVPLYGRMLLFDGASAHVREIRFERDPQCAVCGDHPEIHELRMAAAGAPEVAEVEVSELDQALRSASLLDIREPHEAVLGSIDGAITIPFSQLESRLNELDMNRAYVVACRIGVKSRWAAERLQAAGVQRVAHLRGGLLAYAAARHECDRII